MAKTGPPNRNKLETIFEVITRLRAFTVSYTQCTKTLKHIRKFTSSLVLPYSFKIYRSFRRMCSFTPHTALPFSMELDHHSNIYFELVEGKWSVPLFSYIYFSSPNFCYIRELHVVMGYSFNVMDNFQTRAQKLKLRRHIVKLSCW